MPLRGNHISVAKRSPPGKRIGANLGSTSSLVLLGCSAQHVGAGAPVPRPGAVMFEKQKQ